MRGLLMHETHYRCDAVDEAGGVRGGLRHARPCTACTDGGAPDGSAGPLAAAARRRCAAAGGGCRQLQGRDDVRNMHGGERAGRQVRVVPKCGRFLRGELLADVGCVHEGHRDQNPDEVPGAVRDVDATAVAVQQNGAELQAGAPDLPARHASQQQLLPRHSVPAMAGRPSEEARAVSKSPPSVLAGSRQDPSEALPVAPLAPARTLTLRWFCHRWWEDTEDFFFGNCKCPFYLNGTDCGLVLPPARLPKAKSTFDVCGAAGAGAVGPTNGTSSTMVWDGSFINLNLTVDKHMECYLNRTTTPFKVCAHRVNVTLAPNAKSSSMRDIRMQILQRRRADHPQAQPPDLVATMQGCISAGESCKWPLVGPTVQPPNKQPPCVNATGRTKSYGVAACLFPRHDEIDCRLVDCTPKYQPGEVAGTYDAVYTCASASCTSWAGLEAAAKALLAPISNQKNLQFKFTDVDEKLGKSRVYFVTSAITFDLSCTTGQCIPSNETAPNGRPAVDDSLTAWQIASIAVLVLAAILGTGVAWAVIKQRRPASTLTAASVVISTPREQLRGVTVAFANVTYDVAIGGDNRRVLKGATGLISPGEICAIMGPSGAGKSSLLDIIATQDKRGTVGGQRAMLSGGGNSSAAAAVVPSDLIRKRVCRYVMQDERLMATETVEEALTFSACMTLPNDVGMDDIAKRVDRMIGQLGLERCRKTRIGSSDSGGLSGGERRRLAVGVELIADPAVLLLDEPTSGLDSVSADVVMTTLAAAAAKEGRCVILTIHQPSSQIFRLFDKICLLGPGGSQVWFGSPADALSVARAHRVTDGGGGVPAEEGGLNPAEEVLVYAVAAGGGTNGGGASGGGGPVIPFAESTACQLLQSSVTSAIGAATTVHNTSSAAELSLNAGGSDANGTQPTCNVQASMLDANPEDSSHSSSLDAPLMSVNHKQRDPQQHKQLQLDQHPPGGFAKLWLLCQRGFRQIMRDPMLCFLQFGVTVLVAVATGLIFYKPGDSLTGIHNRTGLLFFVVVYVMNVMRQFIRESLHLLHN